MMPTNCVISLDLLRCRAVFYAQWFTVPVIVTRAIEERRALAESNKPGADLPSVLDLCRVTDDDPRFCDKLLMQFVYAGLSFDRLIIDPKYKSTNRTADADNVEVHIYVQDDPKDNRLQIKFHR